ncbi:structural maintenance of chromosome protein [Planoprotostelium fungivorum]|uniref:Structural maintenance of chromosomes protein 5 n=1 Tax=Planoprotostelium fungivorum TaxID=1890364 RepID=A0A2P6NSS1_9EUKA|nr:structural maintenance of chromosome protein [Planoprotostelium fungivorum]
MKTSARDLKNSTDRFDANFDSASQSFEISFRSRTICRSFFRCPNERNPKLPSSACVTRSHRLPREMIKSTIVTPIENTSTTQKSEWHLMVESGEFRTKGCLPDMKRCTQVAFIHSFIALSCFRFKSGMPRGKRAIEAPTRGKNKRGRVEDSEEENEEEKLAQSSPEANGKDSESDSGDEPARPEFVINPQEALSDYSVTEYIPGSVVRIKLGKFVTYDDCEFFPGPRLNVVIGPNGTGKSTIVCALALGLGGGTSILGRAKSIGDFVKHGADRGFVEIEIAGERGVGNTVIRRDICKSFGTSDWKINGKTCRKQQVKEIVDKLNIQVDNLCQFLPQDKVVSFAGLSSQQLLTETEKVLGTGLLTKWHEELIDMKKDEQTLQKTYESHSSRLEDLDAQQKAVEKDVIRFREREKHLEQAKRLEQKRPWVEYEMLRVEANEMKKEAEEAEKEYQVYFEEHIGPIKAKIRDTQEELTVVEKKKASAVEQVKEADRQRTFLGSQFESSQSKEDELRMEITNLQNRAEDRKRQADKLRKDVDQIRSTLESLPDPTEIKRDTDQINAQRRETSLNYRKHQEKMVEIKTKVDEAQRSKRNVESKLRMLSDSQRARIDSMKSDRQLYQAYQFIEQNQDMFQSQVIGPVYIHVNVSNPLHARYLEAAIGTTTLRAFVTQTPRDRETLNAELEKMRVGITVMNIRGDFRAPPRKIGTEEMKRYKFEGWLDELFEAHPAAKEVIMTQSGLYFAAAGTKDTIPLVGNVLDKTDLEWFFTPEAIYKKTTSRYGNRNVSTRVDPLKGNVKFLSEINNEDEKKRYEEELAEMTNTLTNLDHEMSELARVDKQLQHEQNEMKQKLDKLNAVAKKRMEVNNQLKYKERELQDLEKEEDVTRERELINDKIKKVLEERYSLALRLKKATVLVIQKTLDLDVTHFTRWEVSQKLTKLNVDANAYNEEGEALKRKAETAKREFNAAKQKARELMDKAKRESPLTEEVQAIFVDLPNTLEEIDLAIKEAKNKADLNYSNNPHVIAQYEARQKEIDDLKAKFIEEGDNLNHRRNRLEELKTKWEGSLEPLVAKINTSFSKYFLQIGCMGEVVLARDPDQDFSKYAIEIRVKFRNEDKLERLDPNHQSGGERSVSTMLYLISLQEITPCPFRLVDEINQGMDAFNERMIFQVVSQVACRPGNPQYFLITPKLLPNLQFTPEMRILCVNNGPWQIGTSQTLYRKHEDKDIYGESLLFPSSRFCPQRSPSASDKHSTDMLESPQLTAVKRASPARNEFRVVKEDPRLSWNFVLTGGNKRKPDGSMFDQRLHCQAKSLVGCTVVMRISTDEDGREKYQVSGDHNHPTPSKLRGPPGLRRQWHNQLESSASAIAEIQSEIANVAEKMSDKLVPSRKQLSNWRYYATTVGPTGDALQTIVSTSAGEFCQVINYYPTFQMILVSPDALDLLSQPNFSDAPLVLQSNYDLSECNLSLTTAMVLIERIGVPFAWFVHSSRDSLEYNYFLSYIKRKLPRWIPCAVLADYDVAVQQAAQDLFPISTLYGDQFHWVQAIVKWMQWNGCGDFVEEIKPELSLVWWARASEFETQLTIFGTKWMQKLPRFWAYFNAQWMVSPTTPPSVWAGYARSQSDPSSTATLETWFKRLKSLDQENKASIDKVVLFLRKEWKHYFGLIPSTLRDVLSRRAVSQGLGYLSQGGPNGKDEEMMEGRLDQHNGMDDQGEEYTEADSTIELSHHNSEIHQDQQGSDQGVSLPLVEDGNQNGNQTE